MSTSTPFGLRYSMAQSLFERRDYIRASQELAALVEEAEGQDLLHGTADLRLLLARAYYHSAQLGRAEQVLRGMLTDCPTDAYAQLMLGRTLQRQGRPDEARAPLALARVLGADEGWPAPSVRRPARRSA